MIPQCKYCSIERLVRLVTKGPPFVSLTKTPRFPRGKGVQLIFKVLCWPAKAFQVIAGSENFRLERQFLKEPTRASLLALAKSIYYLQQIHDENSFKIPRPGFIGRCG